MRSKSDEHENHEQQLLEEVQQPKLITRNINEEHDKHMTWGNRVADRVASTMGSWRFIIAMSIALAAWIALNGIAWVEHWDPYPFILLNLALSFQAAYAAPIIMMSQNRQEAKDRLRAQKDYETDLKAEAHIERCESRLERIHTNLEEVLELQRRQQALLEQLGSRTESRSSTTEEQTPSL